jgi:hypothetical protein
MNVNVANGTVGSSATGIATTVSSGVVPTGTIQFTIDGANVGSPQPLVTGALSYSLNVSAYSGLHTIGATYSGDSVFAASAGQLGSLSDGTNFYTTPTVDIVSTTQKDFSLTPCAPLTTSALGGTATPVTLTVTPYQGFTGSVTLSVGGIAYSYEGNGAPVGYSFSVSPVTISSTTATSTALTLYAYQTSTNESTQPVLISAVHPALKGLPWYAPLSGGAVLAGVLMFTMPKRRRWGALLVVMLSVAAVSAIGCSNSVSNSGSSGGTGGTTTTNVNAPAGQYIMTVTATSGSIVHSVNVGFTVQ